MAGNPIDGVLSQEAMKAIASHAGVIGSALKQGGISKATLGKEIDQIALIIAAEMDVADGKADKIIHRETLLRKFEKLAQSTIFKDSLGLKSDDILKAFKEKAGDIPETITLDELQAKLAKPMHNMADKAFAYVDLDKDGVISKSEMNAALPKVAAVAEVIRGK